ncbi:MAG: divalent cation tolerance protein CutA [bacterium]
MSAREICRVVLTTAPNEAAAEKLERVLIEKRLASCVNSEKYLNWLMTEGQKIDQ